MGSSSYSDATYGARINASVKSGKDLFTHSASIAAGNTAAGVHESLDPSKANKAGKLVRESLDSAEHPNSVPVAILFDVTGSMGTVPRRFVKKLDKLMAFLVKKGYLEDPHILFGGIGDATCDQAPLQVGQFESGNEMDEALSLIYLEGGGGGQTTESYELGMYYLARHTDLDSINKRGKRGYAFFIGDETPYNMVKASEAKKRIGDILQSNISIETILEELREKFEVFWIYPKEGSYFNSSKVIDPLKAMFGQNFLVLDDADAVCELIASTIGINEGFDIHDIAAGLKDIGADDRAVGAASTALAAYAGSRSAGLAKVATTDGDLVATGSDNITRL